MAVDRPVKGLEDVVAAETALAEVNGTAGTLRYRGYDIHELAEQASFEEIVALLWDGDLPTPGQLDTRRYDLAACRARSQHAAAVLARLPAGIAPMDALRTSVSALAG